eukprot:CAMPEP_0195525746 /NCGR_PEP_ID=MMETSP0794_2-20130614/26340_1 /TAXON_ID=515487 /ORGANISM="Stephanopyxis turris, Strain CCMP 815" /LENGTH=783 /DNA_ID=CAMNT_0040656271 /DNA_START=332 /DNA_END=2683 /DNA_ORIENTATION=+
MSSSFVQSTKDRIWDVIRSGSLTPPPNPLLMEVSKLMGKDLNRGDSKVDTTAIIHSNDNNNDEGIYPKFSSIEPRHFLPAMTEVASHTNTVLESFEENMKIALAKNTTEPDELITVPDSNGNFIPLEDVVLAELERALFAADYIDRMLHLYTLTRVNDDNYKDLGMEMQNIAMKTGEVSGSIMEDRYVCIQLIELSLVNLEEKIKRCGGEEADWRDEQKRRALKLFLQGYIPTHSRQDESDDRSDNDDDDVDPNSVEGGEEFVTIQSQLDELQWEFTNYTAKEQQHGGLVLPKMYEILTLKQKQANLLGFQNYADMYLAQNFTMGKTVDDITTLHDAIARQALPLAHQTLKFQEQLREEQNLLAQRNSEMTEGGKKEDDFLTSSWVPPNIFGSSMHTKKASQYYKESVPQIWTQLTPYFELGSVLEGMFRLSNRLFGINVKQLSPTDMKSEGIEVWNDDVLFFKVYDEDNDNDHVASFYYDPYKKLSHGKGAGAWAKPILSRSVVHPGNESGSATTSSKQKRVKPLICLATQMDLPMWDDSPSLMSFDEVVALFHEFGHGLQHMLTESDLGFVSGTEGVEIDAVEFPSQFMALWLYNPKTLSSFAQHYRTKEPIPSEMMTELLQEKQNHAPFRILDQIARSQLELNLFSNFDPSGDESIMDVLQRTINQYTPYASMEKGDFSKLNECFMGEVASNSFRYKYMVYAELLSCDAYKAFEELEDTEDGEDEIKKLGRRFRQTVLASGGGCKAGEVFKKFRGREVGLDAFLEFHGLTGAEKEEEKEN